MFGVSKWRLSLVMMATVACNLVGMMLFVQKNPIEQSPEGSLDLFQLLASLNATFYVLEHSSITKSQDIDNGEQLRMDNPSDIFAEKPQSITETMSSRSTIPPQNIRHPTTVSNTGNFRSFEGYLIDGDIRRDKPSTKTDELILVLLGLGSFGADHKNDLSVPDDLVCGVHLNGLNITINSPAKVHFQGTEFTNLTNKEGHMKYEGQRLVWITCPLGKTKDFLKLERSDGGHGSRAGYFEIFNHVFNTTTVKMNWFLSSNRQVKKHSLVECTSPVHSVSGKWLIEYIEYRRSIGINHIHLYIYTFPTMPLALEALTYYQKEGIVVVHDWSEIPIRHPAGKVKIWNWEHAQRPARNDCYLRNRGVATYVAFSDADEFWAYSDEDLLFAAGLSFNVHVRIQNTIAERFVHWFETQHRLDHKRIGFLFKSVTVPPVSSKALLKNSSSYILDSRARRVYLNDDHGTILGRFQFGETRCDGRYNCDVFNSGRSKYMLRTAVGSYNPFLPLFFHAICEDYKISESMMVQVPENVGYIRHHAGHFKVSRLGGIFPLNRKFMPLLPSILLSMESRMVQVPVLRKIFQTPLSEESFVHTDDSTNLWSFAKSSDNRTVAVLQHASELTLLEFQFQNKLEMMMTFELVAGGTLADHLITFDWAFRISRAIGRNLFIKKHDVDSGFWIGWPDTLEQETESTSSWNMARLRRSFDFVMEYQTDDFKKQIQISKASVQSLHIDCIWSKAADRKTNDIQLVDWAIHASMNNNCRNRIHFDISDSLVFPHRTDTYKYGVNQYAFWGALRPNTHLEKMSGLYIENMMSKGSVGVDPIASASADRCAQLAQEMLDRSMRYLNARRECCTQFAKLIGEKKALLWPDGSELVQIIYDWRNLTDMCYEITSQEIQNILRFSSQLSGKEQGTLFVPDKSSRNSAFLSYQNKTFDTQISSDLKNLEAVQGKIVDMWILSNTDVFMGSAGSTMSHVICLWRFARNSELVHTELSNVCGLIVFTTGSESCGDISCLS